MCMTTGPSGFIWLRFICAAIISPKLFGLIDTNETITPEKSRDLVLIAKVLQNLGIYHSLLFSFNFFCYFILKLIEFLLYTLEIN